MSSQQFKSFTRQQYKKLQATIKRDGSMEALRDRYWIQLIRHSGVRLCVISQFTLADAQHCLASGRFYCRAETNKAKPTKNKKGVAKKPQRKPVDIPLTKPLREALVRLIKVRAWQLRGQESDLLVVSRNGRGLSRRSYESRLKLWINTSGLVSCQKLSVHSLRHTFATLFLEDAGNATGDQIKSLKILSKMLGHENISTTMIYLSQPSEAEIDLCAWAAAV